jgi:hypothetical protein
MPKKILHVVRSAYRATIEEQDDTVLWFTQAMKGAGADVAVLLTENAVNYATEGQDCSGLAFGRKKQTQPPTIDAEVAKICSKGIEVLYVAEDAKALGLEPTDLVGGPKSISRKEVPALFARYDLVFRW